MIDYKKVYGSFVLVTNISGQVYFGRLVYRHKRICDITFCKELWYAPFHVSIKALARYGITKKRQCYFTSVIGDVHVVGVTHVYRCCKKLIKQITQVHAGEADLSGTLVREG